MSDRAFLDTNVLVYMYDAAEPAKRERARAVLAAGGDFVVSSQVLTEMFLALTRGAKPILPKEEAIEAVRSAAELPVVPVQKDLILGALERHGRDLVSYLDALIIETALSAACTRLLSEDIKDGGQARGELHIEDPFAAAGEPSAGIARPKRSRTRRRP